MILKYSPFPKVVAREELKNAKFPKVVAFAQPKLVAQPKVVAKTAKSAKTAKISAKAKTNIKQIAVRQKQKQERKILRPSKSKNVWKNFC